METNRLKEKIIFSLASLSKWDEAYRCNCSIPNFWTSILAICAYILELQSSTTIFSSFLYNLSFRILYCYLHKSFWTFKKISRFLSVFVIAGCVQLDPPENGRVVIRRQTRYQRTSIPQSGWGSKIQMMMKNLKLRTMHGKMGMHRMMKKQFIRRQDYVEDDKSMKQDITEAEFYCSPGYELRGKNKLRCKDGKWNGKVPKCVQKSELPSKTFLIIKCYSFIFD